MKLKLIYHSLTFRKRENMNFIPLLLPRRQSNDRVFGRH